jgi:hypothetical protein
MKKWLYICLRFVILIPSSEEVLLLGLNIAGTDGDNPSSRHLVSAKQDQVWSPPCQPYKAFTSP